MKIKCGDSSKIIIVLAHGKYLVNFVTVVLFLLILIPILNDLLEPLKCVIY